MSKPIALAMSRRYMDTVHPISDPWTGAWVQLDIWVWLAIRPIGGIMFMRSAKGVTGGPYET